jgi:hypothetical protein
VEKIKRRTAIKTMAFLSGTYLISGKIAAPAQEQAKEKTKTQSGAGKAGQAANPARIQRPGEATPPGGVKVTNLGQNKPGGPVQSIEPKITDLGQNKEGRVSQRGAPEVVIQHLGPIKKKRG